MSAHRHKIIGVLGKNLLLPYYKSKYHSFLNSLKHTSQSQERFLVSLLNRHKETDFGIKYSFSKILNANDFRRNVPIFEHKDLEPYLTRVADGDQNALLPVEEQILAFACTTGSTGSPKIIPLTRRWLDNFQKWWQMWGVKCVIDHPNIIGKPWLQITGSSNQLNLTKSGHQVGQVSALSAKYQNPIFQLFYATPRDLGDLKDTNLKQYAIARLSMAQDVGFIITITAANLITLAEVGNSHKENIIKDIHDGTLFRLGDITSRTLKSKIEALIKPNKKRARRLEALATQNPNLYPKHYWEPKLLSCWTGGTVGHNCQKLEQYYGNCALKDIGYISTEGRHTTPFSDGDPAGPLVTDGAFYEFMPLNYSQTYLPHELEIGREYITLITTSNGLYRYKFDDIVCCRGYIENTPIIEFKQRTSDYSDLEGEKISADQVQMAVKQAVSKYNFPLQEFSFCGERRINQPSRYHLYFELTKNITVKSDVIIRFMEDVDFNLMSHNFVYKQKRGDGSLDILNPVMLAKGTWNRFMMFQTNKRKTGETQYKHPVFLTPQQQKDLHMLIGFSK